METVSTTDNATPRKCGDYVTPPAVPPAPRDTSAPTLPSNPLPSNLPLQQPGGRKPRRSSCRPTFVIPPNADDTDEDNDCAFQRDSTASGEGSPVVFPKVPDCSWGPCGFRCTMSYP